MNDVVYLVVRANIPNLPYEDSHLTLAAFTDRDKAARSVEWASNELRNVVWSFQEFREGDLYVVKEVEIRDEEWG